MAFDIRSIFSGKREVEGDLSFIGTDMHSHLIPGIDDGSPDLETSMTLIDAMWKLGYHKIITTPHVLQDYYPNDPTTIKPGYQTLKEALTATDAKVELQVAAEYYLDGYLIDLVDRGESLLTLSGNKVLIEFSFISPPIQLHELLFHLRMKGYEPVIAHPERYTYYHNDFQQYYHLFEKGFALQVNLLSFSGHYGKNVQKAAYQLLDKQWLQYIGTDLHHRHHAAELKRTLRDHKLMRKLRAYPWQNTLL